MYVYTTLCEWKMITKFNLGNKKMTYFNKDCTGQCSNFVNAVFEKIVQNYKNTMKLLFLKSAIQKMFTLVIQLTK